MEATYLTPNELIQAFKTMSNGFFPDIRSLTVRVRDLSDQFNLRYAALSTGPSRDKYMHVDTKDQYIIVMLALDSNMILPLKLHIFIHAMKLTRTFPIQNYD